MINAHQCIKVKNPGGNKAWRGWGNTITARLLCPIDYIGQFKENPDEYANTSAVICHSESIFSTGRKLSGGELALVDGVGDPKLPAFLYDEDMTDGSLTEGLLRGPLLLAVSFQHP